MIKTSCQNRLLTGLAPITALFLFATRSQEQRPDALGHLIAIREGQNLFHPHHLLYNPIIRAAHRAVQVFWPDADLLVIAQLHNIFWAVLLLVAVFLIFHSFLSNALALSWTGFVLFSAGFWVCSTQVESYIPALSLLYIIAAILFLRPDWVRTRTGTATIVILFALSALYHQAFSIFFVPLAYALIVRAGRAYSGLIFVAGLVALLAYLFAYLAIARQDAGIAGFLTFIFKYATIPSPDWGTFANISANGLIQLINSQILAIVQIGHLPWPLRKIAIAAVAALLVFLILYHARQILRQAPLHTLRGFLLIHLCTFLCFFWWWAPREREFLIAPAISIALLLALFLRDVSPRQVCATCACAAGLLAMMLGIANYRWEVHTLSASRGAAYEEATLIASQIPPQTAILADYAVAQNLAYYHHHRALPVNLILLYFYNGQALPENLDISKCDHIAVEVQALSSGHRVGSFSGETRPEAQQAFIAWLFGVQSGNEGLRMRAFDRISLPNGAAYIRLRPERIPVPHFEPQF